jgi:RNA polymerase sigma-70 factor (ECF subfamily)
VPTTTHNPLALTFWTEFHQTVEGLPDLERKVFELLWYQEMPQAEAAALLHVSESTIRRHWLSARRQLGAFLKDTRAG